MWNHIFPADVIASATGVVGVLGVSVGQIPVIEGIPTWMTAFLVGVVPTLGVFLFRVLRSVAEFYRRRHLNALARVADLKALPQDDKVRAQIFRFQDMADLASEKHAALSAFAASPQLPKTGTES